MHVIFVEIQGKIRNLGNTTGMFFYFPIIKVVFRFSLIYELNTINPGESFFHILLTRLFFNS